MIIIKFAALTQSLRLIGFVTRLCVSACKSTIFDIFYLLWLSPTMFNFSFQISITNRLCLHSHTSKMVKYQVGKKREKNIVMALHNKACRRFYRSEIACCTGRTDEEFLFSCISISYRSFHARQISFNTSTPFFLPLKARKLTMWCKIWSKKKKHSTVSYSFECAHAVDDNRWCFSFWLFIYHYTKCLKPQAYAEPNN